MDLLGTQLHGDCGTVYECTEKPGVHKFTDHHHCHRHHDTHTQVAGKYVDEQLVERAFGGSDLGLGMIVALVTVGTLAPRLLENKKVDSMSVGPFTPAAEVLNGRLAMMGFLGERCKFIMT